jgi:hypothetical protein
MSRAVEEAWRALDDTLHTSPAKLPDERAITDVHVPVMWFGQRLVFDARQPLPANCVHVRACAADELTVDEPVSGVRGSAASEAATVDLKVRRTA